jgi:hypothetical protein
VVIRRRGGNNGGIDFTNKLAVIGDRTRIRFLSYAVPSRFHGIGNANQLNLFQPRGNPRMNTAQMPRPDNSHT